MKDYFSLPSQFCIVFPVEAGGWRRAGSLVVAYSEAELQVLPRIVQENHDLGDLDVRQLSQEELRACEPYLTRDALGAVLVPGEILVEPWMLPVAYAVEVRAP